MKIANPADNVRFMPSGADRDPASNSYEQSGNGKKRRSPQNPYSNAKAAELFEVTDESIDSALVTFQADAQTQNHHLEAERQGHGPGLKVILKDGSGAVIRQFTGEEFLRLRDATSKDLASPGKIFDRKA